MNPIRRRVVVCLLAVAGLAAVPAAADAQQFVVNSTAETTGSCPTPTTCTLPQAIDDSNTTAGDDVIDFNLPLPATITLTGTLPSINPTTSTDKLAINGPGASLLTVTMDQTQCPISGPIFNFVDGTSTMSGLTVSGGCNINSLEASGITNNGGSTLTLDKVVVDNNIGDANNLQAAGGVLGVGTLTITNSTISNNKVNNAGTGGGGGVVIHGNDGLIANSTISGNDISGTATNNAAGGLWNAGPGAATLVNVTLANNTDNTAPAINPAPTHFVVGQLPDTAGGFQNDAVGGASTNLANTIVAKNTSLNGAQDCHTTLTTGTKTQGYNIIGKSDTCSFSPTTGDQEGSIANPIDPLLGPLTNNGGPTPTMALLANSPAIDKANPAAVSDADPAAPPDLVPCRTTDQRGITRPQTIFAAVCDIGAFEVVPQQQQQQQPSTAAGGGPGGHAGNGGNGGNGPNVTGIGGPGGVAGLCGGAGGGGAGLGAGAGGGGGGGCFVFDIVQSLASGAVAATAGVATNNTSIRAEVLADMGAGQKARGRAAKKRRPSLSLIGQKTMNGLPIGIYKVVVRLNSKARKAFKKMRRVNVTLRLRMTAPTGPPLIVSRVVTLKRSKP